MKKYSSIIMLGAPGSGKGTQGRLLAALPEYFHCACGDVFRSVRTDTELGRIFQVFSGQGQLVPDEVTIRLWLDYISRHESTHIFEPSRQLLVLDGIPRNIEQAKLLEQFVKVKAVIHLESVSTQKLVARIKRRAIKENRHDDAREDVIRQRLEIYEKLSQPLLEYYSEALVHHLDALQSPTVIHGQVLNIIHESVPPAIKSKSWDSHPIPLEVESSLEFGHKNGNNDIIQNYQYGGHVFSCLFQKLKNDEKFAKKSRRF